MGRVVFALLVLGLVQGQAWAARPKPATSTKYTPDVRARLRGILEANPTKTYDEIARLSAKDPVLGKLKVRWDNRKINDIIKAYRDEFPRRMAEKVALTPELWTDVSKALLAHPGHSYAAVAKKLAGDRTFLARYGRIDHQIVAGLALKYSDDAFVERREQALVDQLVERMRALPPGGKLTQRTRAVARSGLPMSVTRFQRLRDRHPGVLDEFVGASAPEPTAGELSIVKTMLLENPSLTVDEVVALLGADGRMPRKDWNRMRVNHLVGQGKLPGKDERDAALARAAADIWASMPAGATVEEALLAIRRAHPGATPWRLFHLAEREASLPRDAIVAGGPPTLARQLAQHEPSPLQPLPETLRLAPALAGRVRFFAPFLASALAGEESALAASLMKELVAIERRGTVDDKLAPRDVAGVKGWRRELIERIWKRIGRRTATLDELAEALPEAAAHLIASGRAPTPIVRAAQDEAFAALAALYRREVLIEGRVPREFASKRVPFETITELLAARPDAFPDPVQSAFSADRLEFVAERYQALLAKEISSLAFYNITRLTRDELHVLQFVYPERFPPLGAGHRAAPRGEAGLDALSKLWKEKVVTHEISVAEYQRLTGLTPTILGRLRRERPELFPPYRRGMTRGRELYKEELAILSGRARELAAADPLVRMADVIDAVNEDEDFVARFGPVDKTRYYELYQRDPDAFPNLRDAPHLDGVVDEIRQLVADNPGIGTREVARRMKERYPRFGVSRLRQLQRAIEDLVPAQRRRPSTVEERRADAERLAALAHDNPGVNVADLGPRLGVKFNRSYSWRIKKEFEELFPASMRQAASPVSERRSHPMAKLFQLAVALAPPGAGWEETARVLNGLLVERGLPPYESAVTQSGDKPPSVAPVQVFRKFGLPSLRDQGAARTAAVVAEYAAAARAGATEEEILEAVKRDYPILAETRKGTTGLGAYREMWKRRPADYPELAPFRSKKGIVLRGLGKRPARPRYLGGWDVERALLADPATARDLALASQWARIPMRLPLLDEVVTDEVRLKRPLSTHNVLMVSHLLGSTFAMARALKDAGASGKGMILVGTPYGTNAAVKEALVEDGFDVRVPKLSVAAYRKEVERALDDIVARHRQNLRPVIVLDDGGLVSEILHSDPKYADVLDAFKIVEQTTRGITAAEERHLRVPVINVARSASKKAEGEFIGRAVATKVMQGLARIGRDLEGKTVVVMGHGVVGSALVPRMVEAHARVIVVETNEQAAAKVPKGVQVMSKKEALALADVVIGATGERSLTLEDLLGLKHGTVVASASSKQVEMDVEGLARVATRTELRHDNPLVKLPTAKYRVGRREITVLGDGWPVNFDGDVEDVPAEEIQLTRAAMVAGALQAAALRPSEDVRRTIPLDPKVDRDLLTRWRALVGSRSGAEPIGDPGAWREAVVALGARWDQIREDSR